MVIYESLSMATSSAWHGPAITTIELKGTLKFLLKYSPIILFSLGTIPLIAETTIFLLISTDTSSIACFKNADGITNINTSESFIVWLRSS